MSENKGTTADEHDKKETAAVPVQIATMLKVVMLYDKFEKMFYRWSTHCRDDRDVLVLCMKSSSIVDTHQTRAKNGENAFLLRVASMAKRKCDL